MAKNGTQSDFLNIYFICVSYKAQDIDLFLNNDSKSTVNLLDWAQNKIDNHIINVLAASNEGLVASEMLLLVTRDITI